MITCKICNREFKSQFALNGHLKAHNPSTMVNCKFCGNSFESKKISGHICYCIMNPDREKYVKANSNSKKGRIQSEETKSKLRTKATGRKHTDETKKQMAESRKKLNELNLQNLNYRSCHSSNMSNPEKVFQEALERHGIKGWVYNMRFGKYIFDFAFPDRKIDVEIDGATHEWPEIKEKDKIRDQFSFENGWKVIRIPAKEIRHNVDLCIKKLMEDSHMMV